MAGQTPHLYKVRSTYYFRIRIPQDLSHHFDGKEELKRSLGTKNLKQARRLLKVRSYRAEEVFTTMRSGILSHDQIKALAEEYLHESLKGLEAQRAVGIGVPAGPGELRETLKQYADYSKTLQAALSFNDLGVILQEIEAFLQAHQVAADPASPEFQQLAREFIKRRLEITRVEAERLQGNYANGYDDAPEVAPPSPSAVQVAEPAPPPSLLVSEVVDKYIAEYRRTGKASPQSIKEYESICRMFQEVMKDKPVAEVTRQDIRDFHETLKRYPSHTKRRREFRDKTVLEIVAMGLPEVGTLGDTTIEKYMVRVNALLTWAMQEEFISKNPADGITHVPQKAGKPERSRVPFDREDLQKMVEGLLKVAEKGELKGKPERYWLPLIGLFTGARSNELAQLHIVDIRQEEQSGIWYFSIEGDDEGAKRVKNPISNRNIPVHPELIGLGFLDYFNTMKSAGAPRLWMHLNQSKSTGKYQKNFENWFMKSSHGDGFKNIYMTGDTRKVFHSFRKTFVNELKSKMVPEDVIKDMIGHSHGSITFDTYALPHQLKTMLEAMQKMDFRVDLSPLLSLSKYT